MVEDGCVYAGDRVLPLRLVHNDRTGTLTMRCVGTNDAGRACEEEWSIPPYTSEFPARTMDQALGHMSLFHGRQ